MPLESRLRLSGWMGKKIVAAWVFDRCVIGSATPRVGRSRVAVNVIYTVSLQNVIDCLYIAWCGWRMGHRAGQMVCYWDADNRRFVMIVMPWLSIVFVSKRLGSDWSEIIHSMFWVVTHWLWVLSQQRLYNVKDVWASQTLNVLMKMNSVQEHLRIAHLITLNYKPRIGCMPCHLGIVNDSV